jgi:Tol biopolymer transport system component
MKVHKVLTGGLLVVALASLLVGCGGNGHNHNYAEESLTYVASPPAPAPVKAGVVGPPTGQEQIWLMSTDGSGKVALADNPTGEVVQQTMSPDGRTLVYVKHSPNAQMVSKDLSTGVETELLADVSTSFDPCPSFSYDGTHITYAMSDSGGAENGIRIMDPDGTDIEELTDVEDDTTPAYNRSDNLIVFDRGWNGSICVMNTDGSGLTVVKAEAGGFRYGHPQFLPDGRIVCMRDGPDSKDILIMDADGANEVNLTPDTPDSDEFSPTVNAAGDQIAFATDRNDDKDVYVGTLTGDALTDLVNLTDDVDYDCFRPRFGPIDRDYAGL